jgi:hypothetical protein
MRDDDVIEEAYLWADRITDNLDGLTDTEAAVFGYVISQTEQRGMPCRHLPFPPSPSTPRCRL